MKRLAKPPVLLALAAIAAAVSAQEPIGSFRGVIQPSRAIPQIPQDGVPLRLVLTRKDSGGIVGTLDVKGSSSELKSVRRLEDGSWSADCELMGMAAEAHFALRDGSLVGQLRSDAFTVDFHADPVEAADEPAPSRARLAALSELAAEDWLTDLEFVAERLPELHASWFDRLEPDRWAAAVRRTRDELPRLDSAQAVVRLAQLVALRGDAHTTTHLEELPEFARCPIVLERFPEGVFVVEVAEAQRFALGARVLRVGDTSIHEALALVATVRAAENESWRRGDVRLLERPALLHALGVLADAATLPLTVELDGAERTLVLRPGRERVVGAFDGDRVAPPLSSPRPGQHYWFELDGDTLYFAYDVCWNDPRAPFIECAAELVEAIERNRPERLLIDLRRNQGGSSGVVEPLVDWLAGHPVLNHPSRLFVAIGPRTFSSAMLNAVDLRERTHATLIGEPTGGKPNAYGEVRGVRLPRSGILLRFSTQYFRAVDGDPPSVEPDRLVPVTASDFFAGGDPALAAVRATPPAGAGWDADPTATATGLAGSWSGAFRVPASARRAFPGGTQTFVLAVAPGPAGRLDAAIKTLLRPTLLADVDHDASREILTGRVDLPGLPDPVNVEFSRRGSVLWATTGDGDVLGWALRAAAHDAAPLVAEARFEAVAGDATEPVRAAEVGDDLVRLWADDAARLAEFAWRLLTEPRYGGRLDELALRAARRANELSAAEDWRHLDTLALAESRAGDATRAVECAERALELADDPAERQGIEESLREYRRRARR